jgi:hypothetical protein
MPVRLERAPHRGAAFALSNASKRARTRWEEEEDWGTEHDIDAVFANLARLRSGGLVVGGTEIFLDSRRGQLAALALRHSVPSIYQGREFAVAGGLMSYGGSVTEAYHLAGVYTGRILNGEKPADLPVQQATKVELIINLKTARSAEQLMRMDSDFVAAMERAIARGLERRPEADITK